MDNEISEQGIEKAKNKAIKIGIPPIAKNIGKKPETLLQKLQRAADNRKLEKNSGESLEWYKNNARKLVGRERAQTLLIQQQDKAEGVGTNDPIGKMYTYGYDALHKDTLPYWDRFPLGFYVGPAKGGFYMINLHYLSPKYRTILFDALMDITNDPRYTEKRKLNLTYNLLNSSKKFRFFRPCFKHYLTSQLQTRIVEIPYDEWEAALFLPTADFGDAKNTVVWSDSILGDNE